MELIVAVPNGHSQYISWAHLLRSQQSIQLHKNIELKSNVSADLPNLVQLNVIPLNHTAEIEFSMT